MITRRSFLSALAAIPIIGRFVQEDHAALAAGDTVGRSVRAPREAREVVDHESGMRVRLVKQWNAGSDLGYRADGYICDSRQIQFFVSRDGGKTWEPNGQPIRRDLPRISDS